MQQVRSILGSSCDTVGFRTKKGSDPNQGMIRTDHDQHRLEVWPVFRTKLVPSPFVLGKSEEREFIRKRQTQEDEVCCGSSQAEMHPNLKSVMICREHSVGSQSELQNGTYLREKIGIRWVFMKNSRQLFHGFHRAQRDQAASQKRHPFENVRIQNLFFSTCTRF